MEIGDEGFRMFQVCHWQPFVAGVGPAFKLDKVDKAASPVLRVEDTFRFIFFAPIDKVWAGAGVVRSFGDVIGDVGADVGD